MRERTIKILTRKSILTWGRYGWGMFVNAGWVCAPSSPLAHLRWVNKQAVILVWAIGVVSKIVLDSFSALGVQRNRTCTFR